MFGGRNEEKNGNDASQSGTGREGKGMELPLSVPYPTVAEFSLREDDGGVFYGASVLLYHSTAQHFSLEIARTS